MTRQEYVCAEIKFFHPNDVYYVKQRVTDTTTSNTENPFEEMTKQPLE